MTKSNKATELATLVKQMRESQKAYFRERSPQWLSTAKELERRVDKMLADILDDQQQLF